MTCNILYIKYYFILYITIILLVFIYSTHNAYFKITYIINKILLLIYDYYVNKYK